MDRAIVFDVDELALEELSLPAGACVAIEDSRNGLLASVAAGIATVTTPYIAGRISWPPSIPMNFLIRFAPSRIAAWRLMLRTVLRSFSAA